MHAVVKETLKEEVMTAVTGKIKESLNIFGTHVDERFAILETRVCEMTERVQLTERFFVGRSSK